MADTAADRRPFDFAAYHARVHGGPCFVCAYLAGDPEYAHHPVYTDEVCAAFSAAGSGPAFRDNNGP